MRARPADPTQPNKPNHLAQAQLYAPIHWGNFYEQAFVLPNDVLSFVIFFMPLVQ
jgi:hypothetical protein